MAVTKRKQHVRTLSSGKRVPVRETTVRTSGASASVDMSDVGVAAQTDPFAQQLPSGDVPDVVAAYEPGADTPDTAFDRCFEVHDKLVQEAAAQGHDAKLIQLEGARGVFPDAHEQWQDLARSWVAVKPDSSGQEQWIHYVAQIDGVKYDFTARQFDPDADYPAIVDEDRWSTQRQHVQTKQGPFMVDVTEDPSRVRAAAERASWNGGSVPDMLAHWEQCRKQNEIILGEDPVMVHFTSEEHAHAIAQDRSLHPSGTIENTVYAVAAGGAHIPSVQQGVSPSGDESGFGRVKHKREWAVVFVPSDYPEDLKDEETIWRRDAPLPLKEAYVVPADEAAELLDDSRNFDRWSTFGA